MDIVKLFFDVETTGTNPKKNSIHQFGGLVEVNDVVVEEIDVKMKPHPKATTDTSALTHSGVTEAEIKAYPDFEIGLARIKAVLEKYVNRFDPMDKIWLVGFNNRGFDDEFFRMLFSLCGDAFFGAYFWSDSIDALPLASEYLISRRRDMSNFQLKTVAKKLGVYFEEDKLHDASYDVSVAREVYRIVTGKDVEI